MAAASATVPAAAATVPAAAATVPAASAAVPSAVAVPAAAVPSVTPAATAAAPVSEADRDRRIAVAISIAVIRRIPGVRIVRIRIRVRIGLVVVGIGRADGVLVLRRQGGRRGRYSRSRCGNDELALRVGRAGDGIGWISRIPVRVIAPAEKQPGGERGGGRFGSGNEGGNHDAAPCVRLAGLFSMKIERSVRNSLDERWRAGVRCHVTKHYRNAFL
ncbi:hypothetical protein BG58_03670 [Caballeronia jiangsuensis]|nr:hypothetical protein BG58_03670 [Caballeronia jiangsuensis]